MLIIALAAASPFHFRTRQTWECGAGHPCGYTFRAANLTAHVPLLLPASDVAELLASGVLNRTERIVGELHPPRNTAVQQRQRKQLSRDFCRFRGNNPRLPSARPRIAGSECPSLGSSCETSVMGAERARASSIQNGGQHALRIRIRF